MKAEPPLAARIDQLIEERRFAEARPLVEQWCDEVSKRTGPEAALHEARARHVLGSVQDRLGDHREAVETFERAQSLYERAGASDAERAAAWDEGGRAAQAAGDFERAEAWLRAAATARSAAPADEAGSRAQLADVLLKVGRLEEAAAELRQAQLLAGEDPGARWQVARQAAVFSLAAGRLEQALRQVDEATHWASRMEAEGGLLQASLDGQRGIILFRLGRSAEAAQRLERAADFFRAREGLAGEWLAHENNLAAVWLDDGEAVKSRDRLRSLLTSREAERLGDTPSMITPWLNRAAAEWRSGESAAGIEALAEARRLAEATLPEVHPLRVQVALAALAQAKAFKNDEQARREARRASLLARRWLGRLGESADESQWLDFRRTVDPISPLAVVGRDETEALADAVVSTQGLVLERMIGGRSPSAEENRGWREVTASLPEAGALVNYVWWRPLREAGHWSRRGNYGAIVLRPGRLPQWVDLGPAIDIEDRVRRYIRAARDTVAANRAAESRASLDFQSTQLWDLVWAPILPHIEGVARLYLRPDGMIHFVPWAVLRKREPTPDPALREYFCRLYPQVAVVARAAPSRPRIGGRRTNDWRLVAVTAAPGLGAPGPSGEAWLEPSAELWREILRMPPLPGVRREVDAVRGASPDAARVTMAEPKEIDFRPRAADEAPWLLHFSGHGFALEQEDDRGLARLEAGLVFADCADGLTAKAAGRTVDPSRDGILFAREAAQLELGGTELVTLSACQTALGQWQPGEHLTGLRHAFLLAGARHVAATLWDVNDEAAPKFIASFYERLAGGESPAQALWQSQRAWLEGTEDDLAVRVAIAGAWTLEADGW